MDTCQKCGAEIDEMERICPGCLTQPEQKLVTQADRIQEHLVAHPFQWIPMIELGELVGAWAVHSRIADVRRRLALSGRGRVENRQKVSEYTKQRMSWYRYVPVDITEGAQ